MKTDHKEIYRTVADDHNLPLFFQPWYLDAVAYDGHWDVSLATQAGNHVLGVWPYYYKSRYGLSTITHPHLTPYLGPYVIHSDQSKKNASIRSFERKILKELHDQLPTVSRLILHGHPTWRNWRPLKWEGYEQTTRYTLRVDLRKREEVLLMDMKDNTRNKINSAEKELVVRSEISAKVLYELSKTVFARQGKTLPYSLDLFVSLHQAVEDRSLGLSLSAEANGRTIAGVYVIRDHDTAYLISTGREDEAHSGAVALLIWESMRRMKAAGVQTFDFEGSMIKGIATFFDGFGGALTPYHRLTKTPTKYHRLLYQLFDKI